MRIAKTYPFTVQKYLQGELQSQCKHELLDGEVFTMVGASRRITGFLAICLQSFVHTSRVTRADRI